MGLELGTFIDDLIQENPLGSDDKRQGDDHLRLIKKVLQNTIKRASKAFFLPGSVLKSANYTILDTDDNLTFQCNTATPFTLTLPALDITRAGWTINVVKASTDMNPVFLLPSGGTINGFAKIRRSAAASITQVVWTGTTWVASRPHGAPVGSVLEYYGSNLPQGHLWADGAAFTATDYVELNSVFGVALAPDRRGRASFGRDNMGGTAALRITSSGVDNSGIDGTTLKAAGGLQALSASEALPSHQHTVSTALAGGGQVTMGNQDADHTHTWAAAANARTGSPADAGFTLQHLHTTGNTFQSTFVGVDAPGSANSYFMWRNAGGGLGLGNVDDLTAGLNNHLHDIDISGTTGIQSASHKHTLSGTTQTQGTSSTHTNMPPALICNVIVVAE